MEDRARAREKESDSEREKEIREGEQANETRKFPIIYKSLRVRELVQNFFNFLASTLGAAPLLYYPRNYVTTSMYIEVHDQRHVTLYFSIRFSDVQLDKNKKNKKQTTIKIPVKIREAS